MVAPVILSRPVLGVHYTVDVVGVALGLIILSALYWLSDGGTDPDRVLLFVVTVGILGLAFLGAVAAGVPILDPRLV